jgi:hypothetical protein
MVDASERERRFRTQVFAPKAFKILMRWLALAGRIRLATLARTA